MNPKVSICMPNYNHAPYLPEAIESVLRQSYRDFEFIIIDNCSTDNSAAIVREYAVSDPRISFTANASNIGLVNNLNLCLKKATGEYIKFLFSDDVMTSITALERMVSVLDGNPNVALVASARYVIDEESRIIKKWVEYKDGDYQGTKIIQDCLLEQKNRIGEPSVVMFRKIDAGSGFDVRYRQSVDLAMWLHLLEQGNLAYIEEPLCSFRVHQEQQTSINIRDISIVEEPFNLLEDYAGKPYIDLSCLKRAYMRYVPVYALWKLYKNERISRRAAIEKIKGRYNICKFFFFYPLFKAFKFFYRMRDSFGKEKTIGNSTESLKYLYPESVVRKTDARPKVSVCIPTYNYARYLPEAIESVLNQRFGNYELIIIDDCSNDDSSAVIERYSRLDKRIVYHINESNQGMVNNWNLCLKSARGEYIKFLFGDDVMSSDRLLGKMVAVLDSRKDISLAASARNVIDERSHVVKVLTGFKGKVGYGGHKIIESCLLEQKNKIGEPSAVMFRKEHASRGFDTRYRQIVDLEMWFHILEKGNFAYLDEPLCSFRIHSDQQTKVNLDCVDLDRLESFWLIDDYANKPYIRFSAVSREYMRYGPAYSVWKLYKKGKISRQTALQKIEKHYALNRFYLYYPFFRICRFGKRLAGQSWTGR